MGDLDPGEAETIAYLARCLRQLHIHAGKPPFRQLEKRSARLTGFLPGTLIERVRLGRTTISTVLCGRRLPTKAFLLTLVEALNVDLASDHRWARAWDRIAERENQAGPAADEAERLRPEDEEPRRQLAEAGQQAHVTQARDRAGRPPVTAREDTAAGGQDALGPEVIEAWLGEMPVLTMRSLTELRQAIEPPAASLAAGRASAGVRRNLIGLSRRMQELGEDGRFSEDTPEGERVREEYQDVDARFHEALLEGSHNEVFCALKDAVRQALAFRIRREWEGALGPGTGAGGGRRFPIRPAPLSLWLHRGLAKAVAQCDAASAETFSRAVLAEFGADSLPAAEGDALGRALALLAPGPADADGVDRERFRCAIRAAVLSSRASAAMPGTIIVMGVAGCGKTTIGQLLASSLRVPHAEADSFHPAGDVARMAPGAALTDQDLAPRLRAVADRIRQDRRLVVSCSALKRSHRDMLRQPDPHAWFLHLEVDQEAAAARVAERAARFRPVSPVGSQFAALEPLGKDEAGLTLDGALARERVLADALSALSEGRRQ